MDITPIASSSSGNAYLISDGVTILLIEAGVKLEKIQEKIDLTSIKACLITHEHGDHAKYAKQIARWIPIYSSKGTFDCLDFGVYNYQKNILKLSKMETIGSFKVIPIKAFHDAKEPFAYLLKSTITNETLIFATDTYYIRNTFDALDYIMIECNYDESILENRYENGDVTKAQYKRLISSHMSLESCIKFLKANDLSKLKEVYLMHLSDKNSNEQMFKRAIQEITGAMVVVCQK
ncbi:MAG: putative metallo-hydrolase YycJ [bacterium ADurb.Bin212]|nr:MAG: putative metallo-hydrolase YycJ [bacterium ADurb.Bin212]